MVLVAFSHAVPLVERSSVALLASVLRLGNFCGHVNRFVQFAAQADSADMVAQRAGGGAVSAAANTAAAAGAARTQDLSLLRRPRVFTVAIVWESAQVCTPRKAPPGS